MSLGSATLLVGVVLLPTRVWVSIGTWVSWRPRWAGSAGWWTQYPPGPPPPPSHIQWLSQIFELCWKNIEKLDEQLGTNYFIEKVGTSLGPSSEKIIPDPTGSISSGSDRNRVQLAHLGLYSWLGRGVLRGRLGGGGGDVQPGPGPGLALLQLHLNLRPWIKK